MSLALPIMQAPIGNGIQSFEVVSIGHVGGSGDKTVNLATPIKTENLLIMAVHRGDASNATLIKPETIVSGEYTRIRSERDDTSGTYDIDVIVAEFLGAKSINYYSPVIVAPNINRTTTINAVDTSRAVIIPLGGFIQGASGFDNQILTFDDATTVRHNVIVAGTLELGFCVLELH